MRTWVNIWVNLSVLLLACTPALAADRMHGRKGLSFSSSAAQPTYELQRDTISPDGQFGLELITERDLEDGQRFTQFSLRLVRIADRKVAWEAAPDGPHDKLPVAELFAYSLKRNDGILPPIAWTEDSQRLALAPSTRIWSHLAVLTRQGEIFVREPADVEPDTEKLSKQQFFPQLMEGLAKPEEQTQWSRFWINRLAFPEPDKLDVTASGVFNVLPNNSEKWNSYDCTLRLRYVLNPSAEPRTLAQGVELERAE